MSFRMTADGLFGVLAASALARFHHTQHEARDAAQEIAQNQGSEMFIHGRDGRIRERNSYGNDPFPPRG